MNIIALRVLQALTGHRKLFEEAILKYQEGGRKNMIDFVGGMYRMLKNMGALPEDIAKFQALYPIQEQDNNNS